MNEPRVGVGMLIRRGGDLLLLRRHHSHGDGTWSPPGGNLDPGEDPARCALRETEEETGLRVSDVAFVGVTNDVFEADGKHYVTLWYEAGSADGEAELRAPDEHSELGWFQADALPQPLFEPLRRLLADELLR